MNPLDRLGEFTRPFMTVDVQLRQQKELIEETRADLSRVNDKLATLSERVTRLEGANENDRLRVSLELERFKIAVERHLLTLQNPGLLSSPPESDTTP